MAHPTSSGSSRRLVVFDDYFPWQLAGIRFAETHTYLQTFSGARVLSLGKEDPWSGETFESRLSVYGKEFPENAARVERFEPDKLQPDDFVYSNFLFLAHRVLPFADERDIPFAFTLYPGGGFRLKSPGADEALRELCSSKNFRKVLVTQRTSLNYLKENGFTDGTRISFHFGGTFDTERLKPLPKQRYGIEKKSFDLCFVAKRYMAGGPDKGYDTFLEVAKRIGRAHPDTRFHVVGQWTEEDGTPPFGSDRYIFHGLQGPEFFPPFHAGTELILAVSRPSLLHPGQFDGFPTGCCVQAALCGAAVFTGDPMSDNVVFEDGKEIVIVPDDADAISVTIESYYKDPKRLYELSARGEAKFREVYSAEAQLGPRIRLLRDLLQGD